MLKSKLRNHSDHLPFLSKVNCKTPRIFLLSVPVYLFFSCLFSSLMFEYEKCICVRLLLFITF